MSFNLTKTNVLNFKRLNALNVTGYNINIKETLPNGAISRYTLETIDNPRVPTPVLHRETLEWNKGQVWELTEDIYFDESEYNIVVYLNGEKLTVMKFTYSEKLRLLYIIPIISKYDLVEVELYKDEITYTHATSSVCEYFVEPVIKYAHNMGTHNILE